MSTNRDTKKEKEDKQLQLSVVKMEDANVEYIDSVHLNWTPEIVILTFIQQTVGKTTPDNKSDDVLRGRLVGQMAFTWPHLVRLRDLLIRTIDNNKELVIKEIMDVFKEGENNAE